MNETDSADDVLVTLTLTELDAISATLDYFRGQHDRLIAMGYAPDRTPPGADITAHLAIVSLKVAVAVQAAGT